MLEILCLVGIGAALLGLAITEGLASERWRWLALAPPVLSALLIVLCLAVRGPSASSGPVGSTQLTLTQVTIPASQPVSIGGVPDEDDLVVGSGGPGGRPVPAHAVRIAHAADGGLTLTTRPGAGQVLVTIEPPPRFGLFKMAPAEVTDAAPLSRRLKVCASPCTDLRQAIRPAKGRAYQASNFAIVEDNRISDQPAGSAIVADQDNGLFSVRFDGSEPEVTRKLPASAKVLIYQVSWPNAPNEKKQLPPGRLRARLGFKVSTDSSGATVLKPVAIQTQNLARPTDGDARPIVRLRTAASANDAVAPGETAAVFGLLGRRFDTDLQAVSFDAPLTSDATFGVQTSLPSVQRLPNGFTIGAGRTMTFAVRTLDFRSGLNRWLCIAAILALACSLAATWRLRRSDRLAGAAFGLLDCLLSLRLLIAVEGAFLDPSSAVQTYPGNALTALAVAPLVLLLLYRDAPDRRVGIAGLTASALALAMLGHPTVEFWVTALAAIALALLSTLAPIRAVAARFDRASKYPILWAALGAVGLLLLRFFFLALTWREAAEVGVRISMSLLFVPLTLAVFAPLLADLARSGQSTSTRRRIAVLVFGGAILTGIALASHVVRDNGFAIFAWPVVMGALAAHMAQAPARRWAGDVAVSAATAITALAGLLFWVSGLSPWSWGIALALSASFATAALFRRPASLWSLPAVMVGGLLIMIACVGAVSLNSGEVDLKHAVKIDGNQDRLLAAMAPQRLQGVGTQEAEAFSVTLTAMHRYSDELLGRGYLEQTKLVQLKDYQLTDNVSAIHLMSPFGRLGALGVLGAYAGFALLAISRLLRGASTPSRWLGGLAALTLALVSIYMVLANMGAAFFTGRNVYLLVPLSSSDLLEGLLLVGLAATLLGRGRTELAP